MLYALKNRSVQIILILLSYVILADFLPLLWQQLFYTISLLIKELLIWLMPLTICAFIAHTVRAFKKQAIAFILALVIFETISNFSSVWYAYFAASVVSDTILSFETTVFSAQFSALWQLPLVKPIWWSSDKGALCGGVVLGCIAAFNSNKLLEQSIDRSYRLMEWLLVNVFARLIPLFILGFAAQMYQMNLLNHILTHYSNLIFWLILFLLSYILFLFILGSGWSLINVIRHIKNLLPAGSVALTSGCSLSTMPWTIEGTAKNLQNKNLAKVIIPATTNIQQVGDCIVNAFLCFLIYRNFFGHDPELLIWIQFSCVFVLARFVTAAILGGAIFIMLPIYETYLNFNAEMIAIILALNVVLDPIVTSCNVIANGALCRVFEVVWSKRISPELQPINYSISISKSDA